MGPPSAKEFELIEKLRNNVRDLDLCEEVLVDANLIRWIRARNHNLKDAEEMFRNYIKWFDEMQIGSIFDHQVPKEVSDCFFQPVCGFDHIGCPIISCAIGQMDFGKLMKEGHKQNLLTHTIQTMERDAYFVRHLMAERRKSDSIILYSVISDMEGLSWRQLTSTDVIQYFLTIAKTYEANFPENVHKIIVFNAPAIFTLFWRIVAPFLSEVTIAKIQVFGKNREQWQKALLKLAPKESLPKKYGGILADDVDILPKISDCIPKKRGSY